jgi:hypothetical protein
VPIVLKSGSINLLEPSGPVQACDGIALPFSLSCDDCHYLVIRTSNSFTMKATLSRILIFKRVSENLDLQEQLINLVGLEPVRNIEDKSLISIRFKLSGKHLHSVQKCVVHVVRNERNWSHFSLCRLLFMFRILACDRASMRPPQAENVPVKVSPFSA